MLDFIGTVVTATLMVFAVNAVIVFMDISRFAKLALALAVGLWIGLSAAAGAAGMIAISKPFPVVGIFVALPLLAAAIATGWPAARTAMLSVPMPLMIGLNIGRIGPVGPKLLQHRLHERAIDGLVEIDGAFDETLLGVEGEIICETCLVHPSVRVHAGRGDQFVDVPALDRRRLGQDGNDIVRVRSIEPTVF